MFVISFKKGVQSKPENLGIDLKTTQVEPLGIINGFAAKLNVRYAFELADRDDVLQVWYLHPNDASLYVNTLAAINYNVNTLPLPAPLNISLGIDSKRWVKKPHLDAPMQRATRAAAKAGLLPVVAIGNSHGGNAATNGWINPWSYPEWVISVGAWDSGDNKVAGFSTRGDPKRPETWPDVIADGVDIIGPWPTNLTKSPGRKKRDETNAHFINTVAKKDWHLYTLESGTSMSTALTSKAAGQIVFFLSNLIAQNPPQGNKPIFTLTAPPERITLFDELKPRLTGTATQQSDGSTVYSYNVDLPWKMVKQLLIDTAIPVPGALPYEAGAGRVDINYINQQFGQFGVPTPKIAMSKVK